MMTTLVFAAWILTGLWGLPEAAADADKVRRVFYELENNPGANLRLELEEADLNAFLAEQLIENPQDGVEQLTVQLKPGSFITQLKVDMDKIEMQDDSLSATLFRNLLQGVQDVMLEGVLDVQNGIGRYSTQKASLNDVPLPASLVDSLLQSLGKKQEPPFDPTEPFSMPYDIQSVEFLAGKVVIRN